MIITGTHINYYHVCKRELWLFLHHVQMEHNSDLVYAGNLIQETTYNQRAQKYQQFVVDGIKIDYYDVKNKVVHEIKKSDKLEHAHIWQVKYYLYILFLCGIKATGILEYPKLRKTTSIELERQDIDALQKITREIRKIAASNVCPSRMLKKYCKTCSYHDFCWSD